MNTLSEEADRIEKQIIKSFEDDATGVLDALIGYLQDIKSGNHEDDADMYLYTLIEYAIDVPFNRRNDPVVKFILCAIRWQAEQIAIEEEKLTRPMP